MFFAFANDLDLIATFTAGDNTAGLTDINDLPSDVINALLNGWTRLTLRRHGEPFPGLINGGSLLDVLVTWPEQFIDGAGHLAPNRRRRQRRNPCRLRCPICSPGCSPGERRRDGAGWTFVVRPALSLDRTEPIDGGPVMDGFVPFPAERAARYQADGYWTGQILDSLLTTRRSAGPHMSR